MSEIRFVMVGGFLGAGKTTTIARLAGVYQQRGLRVGIVTNDQADDLVDTLLLRELGFDVGEVAGACFCCNFDELTETVAQLSRQQQPDVVIAEPVGSCTDLAATVIQPLLHFCQGQFDIAPFGVILKPSHGEKILSGRRKAGFSPKAEYIFRKQLEEADFIAINRIDELSHERLQRLSEFVDEHFPRLPLVKMSARHGTGFDALVEMFDQRGDFGRKLLDLDYDVYAEGEAELGWLNCSLEASSSKPFELDRLLVGIVESLKQSLSSVSAETAHLKTIGLWEGYHGVANLVSSDSPAELSLASDCTTRKAHVVVNARVAIAPEQLERLATESIAEVCRQLGVDHSLRRTQSLRPGRPQPTHRMDRSANDRGSH